MARRRKHRGRRKRGNWFTRLNVIGKIGVCLAGVVVCGIAAGAIYVASKLNEMQIEDIPAEDITASEEAIISSEGNTNFVVFGVDSRTGSLEAGSRSDTIILCNLNNATKEVRMISVYRDTFLDVGDGDLEKCNAAYSYGGPTQAINMLNKNLDLNIEDYVTVDFGSVANIIDLLGGVEIDVQEDEIKYINKYEKEVVKSSGKEYVEVTEPGLQTLNGVQATSYSRIRRTAGGDFTRAERQRIVIREMVRKVQESSLSTINSIIDEVMPTIKTSFSLTEILAYAADFQEYTIGSTGGFPFDVSSDTFSEKGAIDIPVTLESNVIKLHEFLYDEDNYVPSQTVRDISQQIIDFVGDREIEHATDADVNTEGKGTGTYSEGTGDTGTGETEENGEENEEDSVNEDTVIIEEETEETG